MMNRTPPPPPQPSLVQPQLPRQLQPPVTRTGPNRISEMEREAEQTIEDSLHIAEESKIEGMVQAFGKFMKANGDACKALAP